MTKRKNKFEKFLTNARFHGVQLVTRFVEVFAIAVALFWSVEVFADKLKKLGVDPRQEDAEIVYEKVKSKVGRFPASEQEVEQNKARKSVTIQKEASQVERLEFVGLGERLTAPRSITDGYYVAPSFRQSPFYVAPAVEVFKFPEIDGR